MIQKSFVEKRVGNDTFSKGPQTGNRTPWNPNIRIAAFQSLTSKFEIRTLHQSVLHSRNYTKWCKG